MKEIENKLNKHIDAIKTAIIEIQKLGYEVTFEDGETGYGEEGFAVMREQISTDIFHERTKCIGQTYEKEVRFYTSDSPKEEETEKDYIGRFDLWSEDESFAEEFSFVVAEEDEGGIQYVLECTEYAWFADKKTFDWFMNTIEGFDIGYIKIEKDF